MNVIMVAEDINKDGSFKQSKGEVMCTVSNLAFIKHYYPQFKTILFVDQYTKSYYETFGILDLFDEVNDTLLDEPTDIDKRVFWAAGKLMAQRITPGPTLTMDLDFRIFSDISIFGVFESDITCLWLEEITDEFYFTGNTALNGSGLNWEYDWGNHALNVSFLYLKDNDFKNQYCELAFQYMRAMNGKVKRDNLPHKDAKHILFVEQYMLNELAKKNKLNVKVLIDDFYSITDSSHIKSIGVTMNNCGDYFYHMGNHKDYHRDKLDPSIIENQRCYNITNQTITDNKFLDVFNKIYEKSEHEGCFC